jgi:hypothetical protein
MTKDERKRICEATTKLLIEVNAIEHDRKAEEQLKRHIRGIVVIIKEQGLMESVEKASKQTPLKAIKTETSSQACPICNHDVNWKYCSNCGQAIEY